MNNIEDINKLSLSEKVHSMLKTLKEEEHFLEMKDAYILGIALALSKNIIPNEIQQPKVSGIYSISQIDPDKSLSLAITILMDNSETPPYRMMERLAEWGVEYLYVLSQNGFIDVVRLLEGDC